MDMTNFPVESLLVKLTKYLRRRLAQNITTAAIYVLENQGQTKQTQKREDMINWRRYKIHCYKHVKSVGKTVPAQKSEALD